MTASQRRPSARARAKVRCRPASDSATERPTFLRLWVSEAERNPLISWKRTRCASARSRPRSLGMSTLTDTVSGSRIASSTSSASASWGMTSGRTKLVTSSRRRPVAPSMLDQPHLLGRGDHLGLVLKAVPGADFADAHLRGELGHDPVYR